MPIRLDFAAAVFYFAVWFRCYISVNVVYVSLALLN